MPKTDVDKVRVEPEVVWERLQTGLVSYRVVWDRGRANPRRRLNSGWFDSSWDGMPVGDIITDQAVRIVKLEAQLASKQ